MNFSSFSNVSVNVTTREIQSEIFTECVEIIIKVAYVLLSLAGIGGNGLVLYLIVTKKVERTALNILLANLSCADLIADISLYPYIFIDLRGFNVNSLQGSILCNFTVGLALFFTCTVVSLQTLTTISINRYICINHPLRFEWQQSKRSAKYFVPFTWLLGIIVMIPNYISLSYKEKWAVCQREWPENINGTVYTFITSLLGLFVPIVVLIYTFIATIHTLRSRLSDQHSAGRIRDTRQKTMRLLAWLIVLFSLCWTPFFIYWLLSRAFNVFDKDYNGDYQRMRVIRLTIMVAVGNTVADPIIYALFSEVYRTALRRFFNRNCAVEPISSVATNPHCYYSRNTTNHYSYYSRK